MKSHIFIFWNQRLLVENPELLNLHKRLMIQSLIFAHSITISTYANTYILLVERFVLQELRGLWKVSDWWQKALDMICQVTNPRF